MRQISDCMPEASVDRFTRISDKALYNFPETYFVNHLLCLEDMDGLSEEAEYSARKLISGGELRSAVPVKNESGQITEGQKIVKGPVASLSCTTKGEIYEDNMSRVFLIAVDESPEQTQRIIGYQNQKAAGIIDRKKEQEVKQFLQNLVRILGPYEVVNPFAGQITLPKEAHKIRRLNELFQGFIKIITVVHQYQRKKDEHGRLMATTEDIAIAIDIMFESIVLKVDELDGSLRQFFERLKTYVGHRARDYEFTRFEVREATGCGKTQQHHRRTEAVRLNTRDIHFKHQLLYVREGKRAKRRAVPMPVKVSEALEAYYLEERTQVNTKDTDAFMLNRTGTRMSGDSYNRRLKEIAARTAIRREISLHYLRHSIATHLLETGLPVEYVRDFLGHSHLEATQIYTKQIRTL